MRFPLVLVLVFILAAGCGEDPGRPRSFEVVSSTPNAFAGFSTDEGDSLVDLRFSGTDRLLAAEIDGTVYVLEVDRAGAIRLDRSFEVSASGLAPGQSATQVTPVGPNAAYLTAPAFATPPADSIFLFDPETDTAATVRELEIGDRVRVLGGTRPDSDGNPAGTFDPNFVHTAVRIEDKLFVTMSNFTPTFANNPGTVLVYDLAPNDPLTVVSASAPQDVTKGAAFADGTDKLPRRAIFTSGYNPQNAAAYTAEDGSTFLLVVNSGVSDFVSTVFHDGSIDVIDPVSELVIATYPIPGESPVGLAIAPRARRAVTGSQLFAQMTPIDLGGLDVLSGLLAAQVGTPVALPRLHPSTSAFVADLAFGASERFAFAVNFNDAAIAAFDFRSGTPVVASIFTTPGRNVNLGARESLLNFIEVRPGEPGRDFVGPDLFAGTIRLADADETPPGTGSDSAIDAFETAPR